MATVKSILKLVCVITVCLGLLFTVGGAAMVPAVLDAAYGED